MKKYINNPVEPTVSIQDYQRKMARYLSTIPDNIGFFALGSVQAYPTGGTGPTAFGSTGYFGSTPLPALSGDSLYTPIDLGDFSAAFRTLNISNTHGGLSRKQSTFYRLELNKPRTIRFSQDFSQFSYTQNTNRNTILSFYKLESGTKPVELPVNNDGYVHINSGINYDDSEYEFTSDYPITRLGPGTYIFLITNDIRYQETTYSISITVAPLDWRFVTEIVDDSFDFEFVTGSIAEISDFGGLS